MIYLSTKYIIITFKQEPTWWTFVYLVIKREFLNSFIRLFVYTQRSAYYNFVFVINACLLNKNLNNCVSSMMNIGINRDNLFY